MTVNVLAEAGLSECARTDMDCMPGFGLFLATWAVAGLLVIVWLAAAMSATVAIISSTLGVMRTVLWVLVVWLVPLFGAIAWFIHARGQHAAYADGQVP